MSALRSDDPIVHRLRTTLDRKAAQVGATSAQHHFDPDRPMVAREVTILHGSRGVRRAALVAAAALLVVVVAGVVLATRSTPTKRTPTATTIDPIGRALGLPGDPAILAPATPDGMQLWSMTTFSGSAQTTFATTQLFGRLDATGSPSPGLLVELTRVDPHTQVFPGWPDRVDVRGVSAAVHASKDAGAAPQELSWIDGNVMFRVTIRGLSPADAAGVLDRLRPRTGDLLDGFDPASAPPGIELLGEHTQRSDAPPASDAYLVYGSHAPVPGADAELTVHSTTGYQYPGFLRTWIAGTGNRDGSESFDPDIGLIVSRPDGQVTVGPPSLGRAALERVAKTVKMQDAADTQRAREALNRRLLDLPLVGRGDVGPVHLELHGRDATTVCASTEGGEAVCAPLMGIFSPSGHAMNPSVVGTARQGDGWLAFAIGRSALTFTSGYDEQHKPLALPYQLHTMIAGRQVAIAVVPGATHVVDVTADGTSFAPVPRPAA